MVKSTFHNLSPAKRQRIIDAAIDEFGARSYGTATVDRIVAAAGISKGSLYQYFGGKAALYRWLLLEYMTERKMAAIESHTAPQGPLGVWETLEQAFLAGVRFTASEPKLARLGARFLRDLELEPELAQIAQAHRKNSHQWLLDLLQRGQAHGELRAGLDLDTVAILLAQALGEGMLEVLAGRCGVGLSELLDDPSVTNALGQQEVLELARKVTAIFRFGTAPREDAP